MESSTSGWMFQNGPHHPLTDTPAGDGSSSAEAAPWPIPDRTTMRNRWSFRQSIREETLQHRRIHRHGGMGETGRNIAHVLYDRERKSSRVATPRPRRAGKPQRPRVCYPSLVTNEIRTFCEYSSVVRYHSAFLYHLGGEDDVTAGGERPSSSKAVSTISVAFSGDSRTMASTHGDHTVKITCCSTGRLLQTLEGHPRTPWTVKYHPTDPKVVASGCLGHQVRVWDWPSKQCLHMIRLEYAIISLSFHPLGRILAVASGSQLHFWGFAGNGQTTTSGNGSNGTNNNVRGLLTEVEQRHMLRCVHFPPDGDRIIVGGVNPNTDDPRRRRAGGMSFYLRLWDFDMEAVLKPVQETPVTLRRRPISNPRLIVPRALLYNDGGFDVSPDGKMLCACAQYWLPEGIDNAMEVLHREEMEDEEEEELNESDDNDQPSLISPTPPKAGPAKLSVSLTKASMSTPEGVSPQRRTLRGVPSPPRQRTPVRLIKSVTNTAAPSIDFVPRTPPNPHRPQFTLSPPSPPGRRFSGGFGPGRGAVGTTGIQPFPNPDNVNNANNRQINDDNNDEPSNGMNNDAAPATPRANEADPETNNAPAVNHGNNLTAAAPYPPPPPPPSSSGFSNRPPHPLSIVSASTGSAFQKGRYVPHVVTISLDTTPIPASQQFHYIGKQLTSIAARGCRPRLGQLLEACPLDGAKASAVTCVKFSPSTDFCLIGYGVREPMNSETGQPFHPVTALYRVKGGMTHVSTMLSGDDDVNIARFHPDSGYGFVYGTKQGRVRVLSPRPWNYYNC